MKKIVFMTVLALTLTACGPTTEDPNDNVVVEPQPVELDCTEGLEEYKDSLVGIEFCYNPAWGEVVMTGVEENQATPTGGQSIDEASDGGAMNIDYFGVARTISFSEWPEGLTLFYRQEDFEIENGSDEGVTHFADIDFNEFNPVASEELLKEDFAEILGADAATMILRKSSVGDRRSVRLKNTYEGAEGEQLVYYIKDAFEDYHVIIAGGSEIALEVDEFAFDILFK